MSGSKVSEPARPRVLSRLQASRWLCGWRGALAYAVYTVGVAYWCWAYYAFYWTTYEFFNESIEFCAFWYCDFTLFYLEQAKSLLHSATPIAGYYYSPTFALALRPLTSMSQEDAIRAWTWVQSGSLTLYVASGALLLRGLGWLSLLAFVPLTLTCHPILHNWKWGQANTLFVALALTALALRRAPAPARALPLALAISTRYYPAMYALAFVQRKNWRVLAWMAALCVVLLLVVPSLVLGLSHTLQFYKAGALQSHAAATSWVLWWGGSQYLPGVVARTLRSFALDSSLVPLWLLVTLSYALALANALAALRKLRANASSAQLWTLSFMAGCTPLLLPTSWIHYFAYLPFVQAFVLSRIVRMRGTVAARAALFLLLWVPAVVMTSIFFFNRFEHYDQYSSPGYVFFANALMLVLLHLLARKPMTDD